MWFVHTRSVRVFVCVCLDMLSVSVVRRDTSMQEKVSSFRIEQKKSEKGDHSLLFIRPMKSVRPAFGGWAMAIF
jgi:hypothetical protein